MQSKKTTLALLAIALIASIGPAQQMQKQDKRAVSPEIANANAIKLISEIKWHDSLDAAAAKATTEGKLIFYMQMLGKIDGDTWSAAQSLRAVSLSQDPTFSSLKNDFVCGTRDITGEPWSGFSGIHSLEAGAVVTTNGAGPHNIQIFVLAPDRTVLTCLPGYWDPQDMAYELGLAKELNKVWADSSLTRAQKDSKFAELHLAHITDHPKTMVRRSNMQGFDQKFEQKARLASSDTILSTTGGKMGGPLFKTTDVIFHERLARQPFVKYEDFDVVAFSDYGRAKYDKKEEGGGPVVDLRPETLAKQKQKQQLMERRRQQMQQRQKRGGRKG